MSEEEKEVFPAIRICGENRRPVYNRKISRKMCKNQVYGQGKFKDKWEIWKGDKYDRRRKKKGNV